MPAMGLAMGNLRQLRGAELKTMLDDFALPAYDLLTVYPQQRNVPARVRRFVQHLKANFAAPGY